MSYNAHDIAYEIERIAENIFGYSFNHSGTIFDRDLIEKETFYECVALILHVNGNDKSIDFLNSIQKYRRKNMNTIPNFVELFEELKTCLIRK